jgi:hypothetical protein
MSEGRTMSEATADHSGDDAGGIWTRIETRLTRVQPRFPAEEMELAVAQWDAVGHRFVAELERVAADPSIGCAPGYMLHLFAMFLASQRRDVRAHAALVQIARLPEQVLDDLMGDLLTDGYHRCLASTCGGDETQIKSLIEDEGACIWSRIAGFGALSTRVLEGDVPSAALLGYLGALGAAEESRLAADEERDTDFLTSIVNCAVDVGAAPMAETIRRWFDTGHVDEMNIDRGFFEDHVHDDWNTLVEHGFRERYVRSAVDEMKNWAYDREPRPLPPPHSDPYLNRYGGPAKAPVVRDTPKVGRNDPCPCGSGKKYKKCCGAS